MAAASVSGRVGSPVRGIDRRAYFCRSAQGDAGGGRLNLVQVDMTFDLAFGGDPEDLLMTTYGTASVDGLSEMARTVFADPRYRCAMRILIDHRGLDWRAMTAEDVRVRAERVLDEEAHLLAGCRLAIVPHGPAEFGVVRMLWAHIEAEIAFDLGIFGTMDEARAWLAAPRP